MDRPILFSGPMVRAILGGRKSQTRRIVTFRPPLADVSEDCSRGWQRCHVCIRLDCCDNHTIAAGMLRCPYGTAGDRLYVREVHYRFGRWEPVSGPRERTRTGRQRWQFVPDSDEVRFDPPAEYRLGMRHADPFTPAWHKRLARFMPRSVTRIFLDVVSVRVERLQDITEEDARAEGVEPHVVDVSGYQPLVVQDELTAKGAFALLWDSINADRAPWASNPLVWVVSFRWEAPCLTSPPSSSAPSRTTQSSAFTTTPTPTPETGAGGAPNTRTPPTTAPSSSAPSGCGRW